MHLLGCVWEREGAITRQDIRVLSLKGWPDTQSTGCNHMKKETQRYQGCSGHRLFRLWFVFFCFRYSIWSELLSLFVYPWGGAVPPPQWRLPANVHTGRDIPQGLLPRIVELDSSSKQDYPSKSCSLQLGFWGSAYLPLLVSRICLCLELASLFFWSSFPPLYFPTLWKNYPCINSPVWLLFSTHFWDVLCVIFPVFYNPIPSFLCFICVIHFWKSLLKAVFK